MCEVPKTTTQLSTTGMSHGSAAASLSTTLSSSSHLLFFGGFLVPGLGFRV